MGCRSLMTLALCFSNLFALSLFISLGLKFVIMAAFSESKKIVFVYVMIAAKFIAQSHPIRMSHAY